MFTMWPRPRRSIPPRTAWESATGATRFSWRVHRFSSMVMAWNSRSGSPPALLTSRSMPPRRRSTVSTRLVAAPGWVRSAGTKETSAPAAASSDATARSSAADLPVSTTWPPSSAISRAIRAPIPREAPVTRAVLPVPRTLEELICLAPLKLEGRLGSGTPRYPGRPPVADRGAIAVRVVVEREVAPVGDPDRRRAGKDLLEAVLPAVRIVLAPEDRQHGQAGERGEQRPLHAGHQRVDAQHPGQDPQRGPAAAAGAPGTEERPAVGPAHLPAHAIGGRGEPRQDVGGGVDRAERRARDDAQHPPDRWVAGQRPAERVAEDQPTEPFRMLGSDRQAERPADVVQDHRDVLEVEGIDEALENPGVGRHALVVARGIG